MARRTQGCCFAWILRILHLDLTSLCYTETNMQEGINMDFKKAGITGLVLIALAVAGIFAAVNLLLILLNFAAFRSFTTEAEITAENQAVPAAEASIQTS